MEPLLGFTMIVVVVVVDPLIDEDEPDGPLVGVDGFEEDDCMYEPLEVVDTPDEDDEVVVPELLVEVEEEIEVGTGVVGVVIDLVVVALSWSINFLFSSSVWLR